MKSQVAKVWSVVVPTNRPKELIIFLKSWDDLFEKHNVKLIIMQDNSKDFPELINATKNKPYAVRLLSWRDIGLSSIPRKTDMIRSWAFYMAWKENSSNYILTLDDDTRPLDDPFSEYEAVFDEGRPLSKYLDVGALTDSGLPMRGFPTQDRNLREVVVQYGGWRNVPDIDARTQLAHPVSGVDFHPLVLPIPKGVATTCCIMNCAFKIEYTPIMWQLPLFNSRYNRAGDIWSGLFIKKTLDATGQVMVLNGKASIEHIRASNPKESLKKELPGYKLNDNLWEALPTPDNSSFLYTLDIYKSITDKAAEFISASDSKYAKYFLQARDDWLSLFKD